MASCTWTNPNSEWEWETDCGEIIYFEDPGRTEWRFCPYCGKELDIFEEDHE